jgi:hypothetical protein
MATRVSAVVLAMPSMALNVDAMLTPVKETQVHLDPFEAIESQSWATHRRSYLNILNIVQILMKTTLNSLPKKILKQSRGTVGTVRAMEVLHALLPINVTNQCYICGNTREVGGQF